MIIDIAFDRLPSAKGAAVHIGAFARALGSAFGDVTLITVADPEATVVSGWQGVQHQPIPVVGANLIERALSFRAQIAHKLAHIAQTKPDSDPAECVFHVRSIFEGYPLTRGSLPPGAKLVFEVNGVPSIELKYHYPAVADDRELMRKLRAQENALVAAADLLVTPSQVTADYLISRGAPAERIRVIENGVDLELFTACPTRLLPSDDPDAAMEVLYAGTLSAWQGVEVAIEAVRLYQRDLPVRLTVVGPARGRRGRDLIDYARTRGLGNGFRLLPPVSQAELCALHHHSHAVLAPLLPNDRNQVQGCCPLKVLEAMASGTPLIASDLDVVSALARPDQDAILVRSGAAKPIKDAMLRLRNEPGLAQRLSQSAVARVHAHFRWTHAQRALVAAYGEVLGIAPHPISPGPLSRPETDSF